MGLLLGVQGLKRFVTVSSIVAIIVAVQGLSSISVGQRQRRRPTPATNIPPQHPSRSWSKSNSNNSNKSSDNSRRTSFSPTSTVDRGTTRTSTSPSSSTTTSATTTTTTTATRTISLNELLSTCINACQLGCYEIQKVQQKRQASSSSSSSSSFQVNYKNINDPKSALTEADYKAQNAIITSLHKEWGTELHIIGEEEDDDDNDDENEKVASSLTSSSSSTSSSTSSSKTISPLKRDLCRHLVVQSSSLSSSSTLSSTSSSPTKDDNLKNEEKEKEIMVNLSDVTIFVDPVDGTREFVEGRLSHCQSLVGIAVNGIAMAGVIGIPFPTGQLELEEIEKGHNNKEDDTPTTTIVYGQVGAGYGILGGPLPKLDYQSGHNDNNDILAAATAADVDVDTNVKTQMIPNHETSNDGPILASGDANFPLMIQTRQNIQSQLGGSNVLLGGAGNKILATALGYVDCTIQYQFGGPWDTCAPQAILHAMGGKLTDLMGNELLVHDKTNTELQHYGTQLGFVATTGKRRRRRMTTTKTNQEEEDEDVTSTTTTPILTHDTLIDMLQSSELVQSYIQPRRQRILHVLKQQQQAEAEKTNNTF